MKKRTRGLSPKVILPFVTAIIGWVVTHYALDIDPDAAAAIVLALLTAAGIAAPPGDVVAE